LGQSVKCTLTVRSGTDPDKVTDSVAVPGSQHRNTKNYLDIEGLGTGMEERKLLRAL